MSVKLSDIDDKSVCSFGSFFQAFESEVKLDKIGFAQNGIFLLIINKICASTTTPHFLFFTAATFCLL